LIIFAALGAGSYGAGGSIGGLFAALTAYRFLLGIGIGGEYVKPDTGRRVLQTTNCEQGTQPEA
jgi:hypothetical protein